MGAGLWRLLGFLWMGTQQSRVLETPLFVGWGGQGEGLPVSIPCSLHNSHYQVQESCQRRREMKCEKGGLYPYQSWVPRANTMVTVISGELRQHPPFWRKEVHRTRRLKTSLYLSTRSLTTICLVSRCLEMAETTTSTLCHVPENFALGLPQKPEQGTEFSETRTNLK